jgi:catechol 2,3-dioxygenase-like lactoylglutathione lyase family enzyme
VAPVVKVQFWAMTGHGSDVDRSEEWAALKARFLRPRGERPSSSARGLHHFALLSSDVARTITFYQDLLEFPLVELFENRDYRGSTHFFFDVGHDNYLAYFDFPGLQLGEYREVLGGLHHIAISVAPDQWARLVAKLEAAGIETFIVNGSSAYFPGPDGERLELLSYPLNDMYGTIVG